MESEIEREKGIERETNRELVSEIKRERVLEKLKEEERELNVETNFYLVSFILYSVSSTRSFSIFRLLYSFIALYDLSVSGSRGVLRKN